MLQGFGCKAGLGDEGSQMHVEADLRVNCVSSSTILYLLVLSGPPEVEVV